MHHSSVIPGILLLIFACGCSGDADFKPIPTPPTVVISAPTSGSSFMQLEPILFEGKGLSTKYTPDLLLHTWTSGAVTMCETSEAPADGLINCAWAFEDFGEHTITVTITDPDSEFATDTIVIDIIENNPPTIVIEDPIADEVYDF